MIVTVAIALAALAIVAAVAALAMAATRLRAAAGRSEAGRPADAPPPIDRRRAIPDGEGVADIDRKGGKAMLEGIMRIFREHQEPPPAATTTPQVAAPRVRTDPDMPGIPDSARDRIKAINALFDHIDEMSGGRPLAMPLAVETAQIRDHHLPRLLDSYRLVPERHRAEIYRTTGKSASYHLGASLDSMRTRLEEIDRALAAESISTFSQNGEFIQRTYGRDSGTLD